MLYNNVLDCWFVGIC